ncbi:MAG: peptidoglycan-binding protein [Hyphomicrobiaceae bacterium]
MTPRRAKTYVWLFGVLALSVGGNLFLLQSKDGVGRGMIGRMHQTAGGPASGPQPGAAGRVESETVRAVQRELRQAGYYAGETDGRVNAMTQAAVLAFEQRHGLALTAEPSQKVLEALIFGQPVVAAGNGRGLQAVRGSAAERLLHDINARLVSLGYAPGKDDGTISPELIKAIRAFERDCGLEPTGFVSAGLMMHLRRGSTASAPRRG